jgi:hypothetical protein
VSEITATAIAAQLGELGRQMDILVLRLDTADRVSVSSREDYTLAYAKAFLGAEGSAETRKQLALLATHESRLASEVHEQIVRGLRRQLESIRSRIEVGRTMSATARSEAGLAGTGAWGK